MYYLNLSFKIYFTHIGVTINLKFISYIVVFLLMFRKDFIDNFAVLVATSTVDMMKKRVGRINCVGVVS